MLGHWYKTQFEDVFIVLYICETWSHTKRRTVIECEGEQSVERTGPKKRCNV
jgi:hypothetical protein